MSALVVDAALDPLAQDLNLESETFGVVAVRNPDPDIFLFEVVTVFHLWLWTKIARLSKVIIPLEGFALLCWKDAPGRAHHSARSHLSIIWNDDIDLNAPRFPGRMKPNSMFSCTIAFTCANPVQGHVMDESDISCCLSAKRWDHGRASGIIT